MRSPVLSLDLSRIAEATSSDTPLSPAVEVTKSQRAAMKRYTSLEYGNTNSVLRAALPGATERPEVVCMDRVLEVLQQSPLRHRGVVYRAVDDREILDWSGLKPGDAFVDRGYRSTTHASHAEARTVQERFAGAGTRFTVLLNAEATRLVTLRENSPSPRKPAVTERPSSAPSR